MQVLGIVMGIGFHAFGGLNHKFGTDNGGKGLDVGGVDFLKGVFGHCCSIWMQNYARFPHSSKNRAISSGVGMRQVSFWPNQR